MLAMLVHGRACILTKINNDTFQGVTCHHKDSHRTTISNVGRAGGLLGGYGPRFRKPWVAKTFPIAGELNRQAPQSPGNSILDQPPTSWSMRVFDLRPSREIFFCGAFGNCRKKYITSKASIRRLDARPRLQCSLPGVVVFLGGMFFGSNKLTLCVVVFGFLGSKTS